MTRNGSKGPPWNLFFGPVGLGSRPATVAPYLRPSPRTVSDPSVFVIDGRTGECIRNVDLRIEVSDSGTSIELSRIPYATAEAIAVGMNQVTLQQLAFVASLDTKASLFNESRIEEIMKGCLREAEEAAITLADCPTSHGVLDTDGMVQFKDLPQIDFDPAHDLHEQGSTNPVAPVWIIALRVLIKESLSRFKLSQRTLTDMADEVRLHPPTEQERLSCLAAFPVNRSVDRNTGIATGLMLAKELGDLPESEFDSLDKVLEQLRHQATEEAVFSEPAEDLSSDYYEGVAEGLSAFLGLLAMPQRDMRVVKRASSVLACHAACQAVVSNPVNARTAEAPSISRPRSTRPFFDSEGRFTQLRQSIDHQQQTLGYFCWRLANADARPVLDQAASGTENVLVIDGQTAEVIDSDLDQYTSTCQDGRLTIHVGGMRVHANRAIGLLASRAVLDQLAKAIGSPLELTGLALSEQRRLERLWAAKLMRLSVDSIEQNPMVARILAACPMLSGKVQSLKYRAGVQTAVDFGEDIPIDAPKFDDSVWVIVVLDTE